MCIAQLLSPADMVDVAAALTHEEGDLFSIVTSARKYGAVGAISLSLQCALLPAADGTKGNLNSKQFRIQNLSHQPLGLQEQVLAQAL